MYKCKIKINATTIKMCFILVGGREGKKRKITLGMEAQEGGGVETSIINFEGVKTAFVK